VRFDRISWSAVDGLRLGAEPLSKPIAAAGRSVLVVDAPQALAAPGRAVRECEVALRAPGRTPDVLPVPGPPFAGFIRGGILFFEWLRLRTGARLADLDAVATDDASLFEAFPGAAWTVLDPRLPAKSSLSGRRRRLELLRDLGLRFPRGLPSHDQLDAALCAYLGWLARNAPSRVALTGLPVWEDPSGVLREGRILTLAGSPAGAGRGRPCEGARGDAVDR